MDSRRAAPTRLPRKRVIVVVAVVVVALYLAYLPSGGGLAPRGSGGGGALKTLSALHRRWTEGVAKRPVAPPVVKVDDVEGEEDGAVPPGEPTAQGAGDGPPDGEAEDEEAPADEEPSKATAPAADLGLSAAVAPAPVVEEPAAPPTAVAVTPPPAPPAPSSAPPPPSAAGVHVPAGPQAAPASQPRALPPYPTAKPDPKDVIMTMISANNAARHAVALVQTLRDVDTRADAIVIMVQRGGTGSPECHNREPRAAAIGRPWRQRGVPPAEHAR